MRHSQMVNVAKHAFSIKVFLKHENYCLDAFYVAEYRGTGVQG